MKKIILLIFFCLMSLCVWAQKPDQFPLAPQVTLANCKIDSIIFNSYWPGRPSGVNGGHTWKMSFDSLGKTIIRLYGSGGGSTPTGTPWHTAAFNSLGKLYSNPNIISDSASGTQINWTGLHDNVDIRFDTGYYKLSATYNGNGMDFGFGSLFGGKLGYTYNGTPSTYFPLTYSNPVDDNKVISLNSATGQWNYTDVNTLISPPALITDEIGFGISNLLGSSPQFTYHKGTNVGGDPTIFTIKDAAGNDIFVCNSDGNVPSLQSISLAPSSSGNILLDLNGVTVASLAGSQGFVGHRTGGKIVDTTITATGIGAWSTTGNSGTNSGTNFIGTTDSAGIAFRTNDTTRVYIGNNGVFYVKYNGVIHLNLDTINGDYGIGESITGNPIAQIEGLRIITGIRSGLVTGGYGILNRSNIGIVGIGDVYGVGNNSILQIDDLNKVMNIGVDTIKYSSTGSPNPLTQFNNGSGKWILSSNDTIQIQGASVKVSPDGNVFFDHLANGGSLRLLTVDGTNGKVGNALQEFSSNANAISGGLSAGDLYILSITIATIPLKIISVVF